MSMSRAVALLRVAQTSRTYASSAKPAQPRPRPSELGGPSSVPAPQSHNSPPPPEPSSDSPLSAARPRRRPRHLPTLPASEDFDEKNVQEGSPKLGSQKTLAESYKSLSYQNKLIFLALTIGGAMIGLVIADKVEEQLPARKRGKLIEPDSSGPISVAQEAENSKSNPKPFSITFVDRK